MLHKAPSDVIRVAIARNAPDVFDNCKQFPQFTATVDCPFPGWCLEVLDYISGYIDVRIEPIIMPYKRQQVDWGTFDEQSGNWSGVFGYLQRGEVDTACLMYQRTDLREKYFSFADSVMSVRQLFMTLQRQESMTSKIVKLVSTFDMQTWGIMIAITMFQMILIEIIGRFECKYVLRCPYHWFRTSWSMLQLILKQREEVVHEISTLAVPIDQVSYLSEGEGGLLRLHLHVLEIWGHYYCNRTINKGIMVFAVTDGATSILGNIVIPAFSNTDEMITLIASGQYRMVTAYLGNWYFDELKHSNASHYVSLREALKGNPIVIANSTKFAYNLLQQGNYIYPGQEDGITLSYLQCNLNYVSKGMPTKSAHFAFQKNSSWLPVWNEAIVLTQSFQERIFRKYFESGMLIGAMKPYVESYQDNLPHCDDSAFQAKPEGSPLNLDSVLGPLMLLGIGLFVAFGFQIVEFCFRRRQKVLANNT